MFLIMPVCGSSSCHTSCPFAPYLLLCSRVAMISQCFRFSVSWFSMTSLLYLCYSFLFAPCCYMHYSLHPRASFFVGTSFVLTLFGSSVYFSLSFALLLVCCSLVFLIVLSSSSYLFSLTPPPASFLLPLSFLLPPPHLLFRWCLPLYEDLMCIRY